MTLRKRTILLTSITTIFFILVLYIISKLIILNGYIILENQRVYKSLEQIKNAIKSELQYMDIIVRDWAVWDDSYNFLLNFNKNYVKANLDGNSLESLDLNFIIYVDLKNNIYIARSITSNDEKSDKISKELYREIFRSENIIVNHKRKSSGIILVKNEPLLIVSHPIVKGDSSGNPVGTIIMAKYLNEKRKEKLIKQVNIPFNFYLFNKDDLPKDLSKAKEKLVNGEIYYVNIENNKKISGYTIINDIYDNPILILQAEFYRGIYLQGLKTMYYYLALVIAWGIIFILLISIIIDRFILTNIKKLSEFVSVIGENKIFDAKVELNTKDEIGVLAKSINSMLGELNEATKEIRESEEKMRKIIQNMPVMIMALSKNGNLLSWNNESEKITGYKGDEAENILDLLFRDEKYKEYVKNKLFTKREYLSSEIKITCSNMTEKIILWHNLSMQIPIKGWYIWGLGIDITARVQAEKKLEKYVLELKEALKNNKTLSGLIPICANCKKVRDDKGYWNQVENYIKEHSDANFSHSMCPDCFKALYPELYERKMKKKNKEESDSESESDLDIS